MACSWVKFTFTFTFYVYLDYVTVGLLITLREACPTVVFFSTCIQDAILKWHKILDLSNKYLSAIFQFKILQFLQHNVLWFGR
jgi:hypothetical protein